MNCPSFDMLSAYLDGRTTREEASEVSAHLPACAACAASLASLGSARRALAAYAVPPAPAGLAARILAAAPGGSSEPWWSALWAELSGGLLQPAGAIAAAALAVAAFFAWRAPAVPTATAEAELEVPVEVLTAAHRRYALQMPLAPLESALPPVELRIASAQEERDVY